MNTKIIIYELLNFFIYEKYEINVFLLIFYRIVSRTDSKCWPHTTDLNVLIFIMYLETN